MRTTLPLLAFLVLTLTARPQAVSVSPERRARVEAATKARFEYAQSSRYDPYSSVVREVRKNCWQWLEQSEFAKTVAEADRGLAIDPYNIEILMAKAAALRAANDVATADRIREQWIALADSVLLNGDGKGFATAFRVITVDEEYAVIRLMGLEISGQMLVEDEGKQFDVLKVSSRKGGAPFDLYFNVDLPLGQLHSQLQAAHAVAKPGEKAAPAGALTPSPAAPGGTDRH